MTRAVIHRGLVALLIAIATFFGGHVQQPQPTSLQIFSTPAASPEPPHAPELAAALLGGGGDVDDAARFLCEHSHGGELVVLRASGADAYNPYFHQLCPNNSVTTLLTPSAEAANDARAIEHVRNAHAIFLAGGDQSNYVKFWAGPLQAEINKAIARGVPIGGTSAGLAVLGQFAFSARNDTVTSDEALKNPFDAKVTLERDFLSIPMLRGIITDSHFSARQRMGRTVAFVARIVHDGWSNPARAIGIDEGTAVLAEANGQARVTGKGSAYFLELAHQPEECAPGKALTVLNLTAYQLHAGADSRFDLKTWKGAGGSSLTVEVVDGTMTAR
jgi:cyanophycinase